MATDESRQLERQVDTVMEACRAFVAIVALSQADEDTSITLPQWRVLAIVNRHGPQNLGGIAEWMGVHPSTATRACDALVRLGLLDRRDDPNDRRRLMLTLSADGQALVDSLLDRRRQSIAGVLSDMPAARRARLVEAMQHFADAIGDAPERAAAPVDWAQ